jgi:hypothetical protein
MPNVVQNLATLQRTLLVSVFSRRADERASAKIGSKEL